ncbi:hypothetical protein [Salipiger abyssi]|uniref:DUF3313 domain-containing protein n=1 Tax=Salipiger abyssi TaxID=1250539 RepID=A0A1P8UR89_9RHOB|nr:hypothetical protein [Salipiger abyssi]APZ51899.1 hypothetical protein Ga0080574_TMP1565 [Salipiger abyssi]
MPRLIPALGLVLGLAACANGQTNLQKPVEPLGNFKLGHAEVVAPNIVKGPVSREASAEEWIAEVDKALEERFRRHEGDKYYHLGVSVEGYVLAQPGIPLVFSPKSALIVRVTVWDDAAGKKLNAEPEQITALESFSAETVVGSGVTQSKAEQMRNLSANVALQIEKWMRRMQKEEGWFGGLEANPPAAPEAAAETPAGDAVEDSPPEAEAEDAA